MKPNLPKLLTLSLSLQFILAPIAPAMAKEKENKKDFANTANKVLNIGTGLMQSAGINTMGIGGGNMGVYSNDLNMLEQQKLPVQDPEVFNSALLRAKIPGLSEYLASHPANLDCQMLKPLNVVEPDICDPSGGGIPQDPRVSSMYLGQAKQFETHFKDINNLYSDSSKEFIGAKACMTKATNVLENFFNDKLSELNKLNSELSRMNSEFIMGAKGEKSEIALATEILDGKDPILANDIDAGFRERELKKLEKEFGNPACNSLEGFKAENLFTKGLRKSQTEQIANLDMKSPNGLNGASFTSKYGEVVADINKVANGAATYVKTKFGEAGMGQNSLANLLAGVPGQTASNFGINNLIKSTEYSELSTNFNNEVLPLNKLQSTAVSELGSFKSMDPEVIAKLADPSATNFDDLLGSMANRMKQECLNRALASSNSSLDFIKSKSYDLTKSKEANTNSSYIFDTNLKNILTQENTSPEEKLALLKAAKKDERRVVRQNSWFNTTVLGADGTKSEKTVAKGNIAASDFYAEVINNCDAQFKSNRLKASMTGQTAINTLKSLRNQYTKMANTQAEKLKQAITKRLINCESSDIANSTQAGSCSPARFDTTKASFCAAAANSCSTNMQACNNQTKQNVETLEKSRTAKVQNYNRAVTNHVAALKSLYEKSQGLYEGQIKAMQGGFPSLGVASFSVPDGIVSDPKTTKLAGFSDHEVFLEDPAAAFDAFKKNVSLLKAEVTSYKTAFMKGVNDYARKNERLYASVSEKAGQMETNCKSAVQGFTNNMNKKGEADLKILSEFGEKLPEFCDRFGTAHDRPDIACQGDTAELVKSALLASNKLGSSAAAAAAMEFQKVCRSYGSESGTGSKNEVDVWTMCGKLKDATTVKGSGKKSCEEYTKTADLDPTDKSCKEADKAPEFKKQRLYVIGKEDQKVEYTCDDESYRYQTKYCIEIIVAGDCDKKLESLLARIKTSFTATFPGGVVSDGPKLDSSTASPEFCVADDDSHYRYNDRGLKQAVTGQQGGALASGQ
jgi:hypothetical protein